VTPPARRGPGAAAVGLTLALLGWASVPAFGQGDGYGPPPPTRAQFVRAADAECKQANPKSERLAKRFSRAARRGHPVRAGRAVIALGRHLLHLIADIAKLDRPPDDAERIERWLELGERSTRVAIKSGRAAKQKRLGRANRLLDRSSELSDRSYKQVRGFDFKHC
jgi:hypothetical protein